MWNGRRYHSFDAMLKERFGEKLYKLTLQSGLTCPNRDGTLSSAGCLFCSAQGAGEFAAPSSLPLNEQIDAAKALISSKYQGSRFIAYYQSFTNTYAPAPALRALYTPVIRREDIAVLSIATRPDCLGREQLQVLEELAKEKPLWVELGLQTASDATARRINRCYPTRVYDEAVRQLHGIGAEVITHMIAGLPGEGEEDAFATAEHIGQMHSDGIKIHLLHVLKGTGLAALYERGEYVPLTEEEYVRTVAGIISRLPGEMVIHRLTGDGSKESLLSPLWSRNKRAVLNHIQRELRRRQIVQGDYFRETGRKNP